MACYKWNTIGVTDHQIIQHSKFWDRSGIFISGLCVVHCVLFPVLIILLPATRSFFYNPILEIIILVLGIIIGSISFVTSYRQHRKPYPMMLGLTGVAFLALNLFVFVESESHVELSGIPIDPLMILGGSFLIAGHAWNIHACHCFCDKSCDHQEHEQGSHHDHDHDHDH